MATFSRLFTRRACRSAISSSKTINPTCLAQPLQTRLYHGCGTQQQVTSAFIGCIPFSSFESTRSLCIPLVLASIVGVGILDVAYADTSEVSADSPLPPDIPSSYDNLEEIAKKEQWRLEDLIRSKGMEYGSYPQFTVALKGEKIAIKFPVPAYCEIPRLIENLASSLNGGSLMDAQIRDR
ncbi:uncharacterized protein LOC110735002 [Chenopodium quinoa]|uniref:uncharacterized protein LOC110735002 n=1 Tax=Chenopodium quinoa TaxID=63459 RepID=UPI000B785F29|nr:uncharacterized protein LOC110735002 [Chenopodium quinoa]